VAGGLVRGLRLARARPVAFQLAVIAALLALAAPVAAAGSSDVTGDTTPPRYESMTLTPSSVDVTSGPARLTLRFRATDDLSGVNFPTFSWMRPSANVTFGIAVNRVSGDERDGTYEGSFDIPRGSPAGTYTLMGGLADRVGNGRQYMSEDLIALGFPGTFEVTDSDPDNAPPTLHGVGVSPTTADARGAAASVTVTLDISDDKSGVYAMAVFLVAPDATSGGAHPPNMRLVSGDTARGTWSGTAMLPEPSVRLNRPIVGMVASTTGPGYLMVGEDGGIFTFGTVAFRGSLGSRPPAEPIVAVAAF
jgi:hypothetical protein